MQTAFSQSVRNGQTAAPGVTTTVVTVTPKIAKEWLERNTHNRPLRSMTADSYADRMRAGQWVLTHQGIAFDVDGNILDGQHRLEAVVRSGITVQMLVTRGLPREAQIVVDDHSKRSPFDAIALSDGGGDLTKEDVAIAAALHRGAKNHTYRLNKVDLKAFIEKHYDAIKFASALRAGHGAKRAITQMTNGTRVKATALLSSGRFYTPGSRSTQTTTAPPLF
jgi:hypothetical protein